MRIACLEGDFKGVKAERKGIFKLKIEIFSFAGVMMDSTKER